MMTKFETTGITKFYPVNLIFIIAFTHDMHLHKTYLLDQKFIYFFDQLTAQLKIKS